MEATDITLSLRLPRDATMHLDGARDVRLHVRSGRLWVTEQGRPEDVFLGPGDAWRLRAGGRAVVQADAASAFELAGPRWLWLVRLRSWLGARARALSLSP